VVAQHVVIRVPGTVEPPGGVAVISGSFFRIGDEYL